nr:Fe-S-binding domain-containing protein [Chloroflexota bacterium]
MEFISSNLLTLILFLPVLSALVVAFLPSEEKKLIRWVALIASFIPFVLSLVMWFQFDSALEGFQFEQQVTWFAAINSSFHLGVDGISLTMVLLTTLLTPLCILASFGIEDRVKGFMALFLMLETGMLGVFLSLDLLLFFVFWEIGLVPMYFLINQWGSEKGERELWGGMKVKARTYASFKFMIYTMAGSLGLLLAIQLMGVVAGTFDLTKLFEIWPALTTLDNIGPLGLSVATVKVIVFWAFVIAFAFKVPLWPFHTWLPDA